MCLLKGIANIDQAESFPCETAKQFIVHVPNEKDNCKHPNVITGQCSMHNTFSCDKNVHGQPHKRDKNSNIIFKLGTNQKKYYHYKIIIPKS